MAYRHVEDTDPTKQTFERQVGNVKQVSTQTKAHSIYRCGHCGALAVTIKGDAPPVEKCGKCHC